MARTTCLLGRCLAVGVFAVALTVAPRAEAQQTPRLAVSEFGWEFAAQDRTREYWEVANIGDTPWNPNGYWAARLRADVDPYFIQIQGVDPVPPGGVLLLEWGRPLDEDALSTACTTQGNVFCTGRPDAQQSSDFEDHGGSAGVMIFAPTSDNQPPTLETGTMLCYFFYGDLDETDRDLVGYNKAVEKKLWKDGDVPGATGKLDIPLPKAMEWVVALRMAPGPYPADFGRSSADYYLTLTGIKELTIPGFSVTNPTIPAPNSANRAGTPHLPNYLHPGLPIPGQASARLLSVQARAVPASLAAGDPRALQVVGVGSSGGLVTSLFANNAWSPIAPIAAPAAAGASLVNNAAKGSRTLIVRAKADGALSALTSAGSEATFSAALDLGLKAKFDPVVVVDAAGAEHILAVDTSGAIQHNILEGGKLRGWQPIAGATTDAPVAAALSTDPAGVNVLAFNGNQLTLYRLGTDGKFGPGTAVGAAVSERPAGIGPVLAWNPTAKRLEIVVLTGPALKADIQHARAEIVAPGQDKVGALAKIGGIGTNALPAIAINPNSGQVRLLARGGGVEPGLNPGQEGTVHDLDYEECDPQAGFVFATTFDGSAWSAPQRVGLGRLPGVSPATAIFPAPVAPVSLFDGNTGRFQDLLIGEDGQIYHNAVQ